MLTVYLVRHGQTAFNVEGRVQGWLDVPLDAVGHMQAQRVAQRFAEQSIQAIYSSPLLRAADTARSIARVRGLDVIFDERLREYHMGDWTGLTLEEIRLTMPSGSVLDDPEGSIPNGESAQHMRERVVSFLHDLVAHHAHDSVILVSHGGTLGAMIGTMLGLPVARRHPFAFGNASVTEVAYESGRWRLRSLNDRCHLQG
ncbi:MAG: histidine phosphatase family protein [Thermoflexales bacterium]|nr:histidine phosphatase family protein [Thermoflexales bacterium]MDW8351510.1 histidine phosphatase family protein [Anaerolineae bacterium]